MKYRSEIDGLRALAVVPVILFHSGFELFSGGFVGVDVFFVISGYLITTILIEDIENKRFSVVSFYERRARRILPALFFVLLVCMPFAWFVMAPYDLLSFTDSIFATLFFISNLYFYQNTGYFDPSTEETPLLHTWSLAVEEQYYILFPIFLFLAWRFGKNRVFWMIVVMAAISLLISEWGWRNKSIANFYLPPTRAWELFAGSIVAFVVQRRGIQKNDPLSLLGLAAIIFAIFAYDESTPFPSVYSLVPVVGVMLLIVFADSETLVARLLSTKTFVGIGLISYSVYLWHHPIIAFQNYLNGNINLISYLTLTFFAAYLSWRFVERPTRNSKNKNVILMLFMFFLLIIIGNLVLRSSVDEAKGINYEERNYPLALLEFGERCQDSQFTNLRCIQNMNAKENVDILLLGDSHAEQFFPGLSDSMTEFSVVSLSTSGSPFYERLVSNGVFNYLESLETKPQVIIFSMHYLGMLTALPVGSNFYTEVNRIIEGIHSLGIQTVLLSDVPRFYIHPRRCVDALENRGSAKLCTQSRSTHNLASYTYLKNLRSLSEKWGLELIIFDDDLCDADICSMTKEKELLYRDANHLSISGSIFLSNSISSKIRKIIQKLNTHPATIE